MIENERQQFLDAIKENPMSEAHRMAFSDWLEEQGFDDEAIAMRDWTPKKHERAVEWIQWFANEVSSRDPDMPEAKEDYGICYMTVDRLIEIGHNYLDRGEYFCFYGYDTPDAVYGNMPEFWQHFSTVTGRIVATVDDLMSDQPFSCSC